MMIVFQIWRLFVAVVCALDATCDSVWRLARVICHCTVRLLMGMLVLFNELIKWFAAKRWWLVGLVG